MIQLKSFTKDAASRTKGLQLKTKLEHAIKEERNISVDFDGIDKFASPFFNNSFSALGIQYGFGTVNYLSHAVQKFLWKWLLTVVTITHL